MEKGKDPLAPAPSDGERATTPPAANDDDSGAPHGDAMAGPPKLWPPPKSLTPITNRENPAAIDKAMKIFAVKVAVIGSVGGVLFGYDLGVVSGALLQLSARFDLQRPEEKGLVVSILLAGSVCGALIGGCFTDRYGRRLAIMCTDLIFIVGSFTIATSPTLTQVLIGRFAVGIGVSVSAIADVAYLNEMAPQKWRGIIVSVNEMMIAGGFLLANFVDGMFATTPGGWRYMFGFASLIAAMQLCGMACMPRSPRWLLLQGRRDEAHASLVRIYGGSQRRATVVLGALARSTEEEAQELSQQSAFTTFRRWRPQLQIAVLLFFFAQFSGQANILSYAPDMFARAAGCADMPTIEEVEACEATAVWNAGYIGSFKFLCVCIAVWKVEEINRRTLLAAGTITMAVALAVLSWSYWYYEESPPPFLAIGSMAVIAAAYSFSYGPLNWLITAELFTVGVRGRALGVATVFNWMFQMMVNMAFEPLVHATSTATTFGLSFFVCLLALGFIHAFLPETRGLESDEIVTYDVFAPSQWRRRCCSRADRAADRRLQRNVLSETSSRGESISEGNLGDDGEGGGNGRSSIQLESVARPVHDGQLARP